MPAQLPEHMLRRGDVFYFRRAIPRSLWSRFGCREIKVSLRTRDPFAAKIRCRLFSNAFEQLIATVGRRRDLAKSQIDQLVRTYFEKLLSQAEEIAYLAPSDPQLDIHFEIAGLSAEREEIRQRLADSTPDGHTIMEAKKLVEPAGGLNHEEFSLLCRGVLRAKSEQRRILATMLQGAYDETTPIDPLFKDVKSPGLPPLPGEIGSAYADTVAALVDKYCTFKANQSWVPKTLDENRRVLGWFRNHVGAQRDISSLTVEDVRTFRDVLLKLPKNFTKLEEFAGKTLADIAGMKPTGSRLGAGTLQKYFACVRSFLRWCEDESYVDTSPAKKIKIGAKPNLYDARDPFSKSQLKTLFDSPQYRGHKSAASRAKPGKLVEKDGKFWIPLVGLFTGMRLGEIVQLMVSDVREDDGLIYFDVNKSEGGQKSLKTKASQREIPAHKELAKMGFMDFVQTRQNKEPNGRLFPEIKPGKNGYPSHNFSKYFGRYLKQVGVKTEKVAFHSFRHSFTDALRVAEIEDSHIKALLGHTDSSITALYGSGVPLKVLAVDMENVTFDVELSHLYLSGNK